jgi:hypothetical protein
MSEQARIIAEIHELVMSILKTGSASVEQGDKIDELEELLYTQKCFTQSDNSEDTNQGEEIANLFFSDKYTQAIEKMLELGITPDDFFGFVEYHYDDEHEDEELTEMFTGAFRAKVNQDYQSRADQ